MNKRFISTSLSLLVSASVLAACGPTMNQGGTPSTTTPGNTNNASTGTNVSGNVNTGVTTPNATVDSTTQTTVVAKTESSAELQAAMQSVIADEADFKDSETLSADGSFQTKALEVEQNGEVSATLFTGGKLPLAKNAREEMKPAARQETRQETRAVIAKRAIVVRQAIKADTKVRIEAKAAERKDMFLAKKSLLESNGALTVNADGTLTIDPAKLRMTVQANNEMRKAKFKLQVEKVKEKIKDLRELAQDKKQKLINKAQAVRTSTTEEIQNDDGSITTITKVEFKNETTGATRQVTSTRTTLDDKLVSAFYTLEASHKNYTRTVERNVEVNADGGRSISSKSTTTWSNGKKRERSEERVVAADGTATGGGSITITRADGTVKTYTYSLNIATSGEVIVNSDDASNDSADVTVEGSTNDSDVTVVVEENGETTEVDVDLSVTDSESVATDTEVTAETETEASAEDEASEASETSEV
jgi:hypothetical protein